MNIGLFISVLGFAEQRIGEARPRLLFSSNTQDVKFLFSRSAAEREERRPL